MRHSPCYSTLTALALALVGVAPLTAEAAPKKSPNKSRMERFVESYDRLPPAKFARALASLDSNDHLMLSLYNQLASDVYFRACQIDASIQFDIVGRRMNCNELWRSLQAALQLGMTSQSLTQEMHTQKLQVLNGYRCSRGAIDRRTCSMYAGTMQRMNDMSHDTSMQIIRNMGNQCRVGVDPGCDYY